jgi:hypothetical protein
VVYFDDRDTLGPDAPSPHAGRSLKVHPMPNPEPKGCLAAILGFFGIRLEAKAQLPYRQRDDFLSKAELSFYQVLVSVVDRSFTICMKVRLADIVFVSGKERWQSHQNRIDRKHIDFLLCDTGSMHPVLGIELDDASHSRPDRQDRDEFVNEVFEAADLPLLRILAAARYVPADLTELIAAALNPPSSTVPQKSRTAASPLPGGIPTCPKCQAAMVLRTSRKGDRQGQTFWGCVNYPRCRETVAE